MENILELAMEKRSPEISGGGGGRRQPNLAFWAEELKEKNNIIISNGFLVPKKNDNNQSKALEAEGSQYNNNNHQQDDDSTTTKKRKTRKSTQILAAFSASVGAIALGAILSFSATALPDMIASGEVGIVGRTEESWIGSIATLGAVAACPFTGFGLTHYGRRKTMLFLSLPFLTGWLLIYCGQNIAMIYMGRFLTGFAGGATTITAPVFVAETADVKIRGGLGSLFDLMVSVGMFYIYAIGAFMSWRTQALCCALIPVLFHLLMLIVPESPRYLVEVGKYDKAGKALSWLYGMNEVQVQDDLNMLIKSVEESKARPVTFRKILMKMSVLKPILVCLGLMFFTTMSGYDAVTFYTVHIFESAGTSIDPRYSSIILGAVQVVATVPAAFLVDKFCGRRKLLLTSEILMCLSLAAMGSYFFLQRPNICDSCANINLSWLPLSSLTVFLVSYSIGLGPLCMLMLGELLPSHIKGLASCTVLAFRWILGFAVTKLFEDLEEDLGKDRCYWLFSVACFIGCFFIYFCVPETKGRSLDEIQKFFVSPEKLRREKEEEEAENNNQII